MKNMYKFVKSITILFVMMGVLNGCEENGNSGDSEDDSGNYEYVDLGLPSGLMWATCNIGASSPEDYGNYYAWGETEPKSTYTEYNSITYGEQMGDISGYPEYDAATANWGSTWRMPTEEECEELVDECTWQWTTQNGVNGYKVIGPNGNHIFLPAAGCRIESSLYGAGESGHYWSSTPNTDNLACYLYFNSSRYHTYSSDRRYYGLSVRPVIDNIESGVPTITTNAITEITPTTAVGGGNVINEGDAAVTSRGVCWSTSQNPTISNNHTTDGSGEGEFTSNVTGLMPNTTYYLRAYATNEGGTGYGEEYSFTTERDQGGYDYVDLGLPSGLKWATCNIGASSPEEYGNYFAWGETEPKSTYTIDNSITYGVEMGDISGNPEYDAATANWGEDWRMPTEEECRELRNECTWQWTTQNGVNGYKVIGQNGNHIFLPAAGYRNGSSLYNAGECGYYWSSTPYSNGNYAYLLGFYSSDYRVSSLNRYYGRSVRPVSE